MGLRELCPFSVITSNFFGVSEYLGNLRYFHKDEIGEIVSSILLKGIQKLQRTRLFSIPLIIT